MIVTDVTWLQEQVGFFSVAEFIWGQVNHKTESESNLVCNVKLGPSTLC